MTGLHEAAAEPPKELNDDRPLGTLDRGRYLARNLFRNLHMARGGPPARRFAPAAALPASGTTSSPSRWLTELFLAEELPRILPPGWVRVLEVGSGSGSMCRRLAALGYSGWYLGVDLNDRFAVGPEEVRPFTVDFRQGDIARVPASGAFDLIVSVSALEHIECDRAVIARLRTLLAPGGVQLHLVPSGWALLGDEERDYAELDKVRGTKSVPVEFVEAGRFQPRRNFDGAEMAALAASVREKGILQPILVRRHPDAANKYEIVVGERRWRAAQAAQLHEIPVIIKEFSDRDALEIALVENLQREGLKPLEEATAYRRLMSEFSHTQEDTAKAVGKSRSHVANTLRLLDLDDEVKQFLDKGDLTAGHARALLKTTDQVATAKAVVAKGLNVRQTENLCRRAKPRPTAKPGRIKEDGRPAQAKDADTVALERDLSNLLGLKVSIQFHGAGGSITIHYKTLEQLDDVLYRLNQAPTGDGLALITGLPAARPAAAPDRVLTEEDDVLATGAPDVSVEPSVNPTAHDHAGADGEAGDADVTVDVSGPEPAGDGDAEDVANAEPSSEVGEEVKPVS